MQKTIYILLFCDIIITEREVNKMKKNVNMNELLKNVKNGGMSGVYKITRKSDGMVYIGQSICIRQRLEQHIKNENVDENSAGIDAAIKKEGADKFTYETVVAAPDLTTEQLWFFEAINIEAYDSYNKGFNRTRGNHRGAYDALDLRNKHKVTSDMTKTIEEQFKLSFRDKKVLLVGNFNLQFVDYIDYQNATITIIDAYEESDFIDKFNEVMENMENKDFDIIISNPPYGRIGCEITKKIIDEIEFKEFVNLLPAKNYVRNGKKYNLWQHVENVKQMIPIRDEFKDAAVTTHIAKIQKQPNLYLSADEFEIENFIDPQLNKFFYENLKREHYAIDNSGVLTFAQYRDGKVKTSKTSIIKGIRDINHCHMPYSKDTFTYKWNTSFDMTEKDLDVEVSKAKHVYNVDSIVFRTSEEKNNFSKFLYSENGFRFISKIFTAINTDAGTSISVFPKVDWTKEWTVEEILKDYGYTAKEIQEVMDDLENFKGMNA